MKLFDHTFCTPAENLAADEIFLDAAENGDGGELLFFWQPRDIFVVAGYANKITSEVNVENCSAKKIPIFRRCSGGGTILQMPGGLNYSLILRIEENGATKNISSANQFIMERNRAAIESGFQTQNFPAKISVRGHTDLCFGDLKFAGNSQRRRKNYLLFHGTILLGCDLDLIGEFLRMPSSQPDYRADREHKYFLTNLDLAADKIKSAFAKIWNVHEELKIPPLEKISKLAQEKYSTHEWNFKF